MTLRRASAPAVVLTFGLLAGCDGRGEVYDQAAAMTGGDPAAGRHVIASVGCASCHTIPGIRGADALVGPPLTQMAGRTYIGGVVTNTPENMVRWLRNPPGVDPMTAMPNLRLTDAQARDAASYLYTLK
jgi:cytochrome c